MVTYEFSETIVSEYLYGKFNLIHFCLRVVPHLCLIRVLRGLFLLCVLYLHTLTCAQRSVNDFFLLFSYFLPPTKLFLFDKTYRKNMEKMFLECEKCGYVQAVRDSGGGGDDNNKKQKIWGCARCKRMQIVNKTNSRADNGKGRRLLECEKCGYKQSVKDRGNKVNFSGQAQQIVWVCYKCRKAQIA